MKWSDQDILLKLDLGTSSGKLCQRVHLVSDRDVLMVRAFYVASYCNAALTRSVAPTSVAMDPTVASSLIPSSRPIYSCVRCSDRKVKCDRQKPCGACVKQDAQCVFRPFLPSRKRQKRARDDVLTDRLKRYEALLQEQGIDPARLPDTLESEQRRTSSHSTLGRPDSAVQLPTPASVNSEPERSINKTQLLHVQGQSKFVDKWVSLRCFLTLY